MGKDWYSNWAGKSSKRGGLVVEAQAEAQTTPSGCMCSAVFHHLFDFHPFHFPTTFNQQQQQQNILNKSPPSCIPEDISTTIPKGAEAPRNSLEEEEEEPFKIPKKIQIKTSTRTTSGGNLNDLCLESPGSTAKTPTLVARLMGLDLLPAGGGSNSPSSTSSYSSCLSTPNPQSIINVSRPHIQTRPRNSTDGTRSLPETPRISSARRSDADLNHHRLSLQINKENNIGDQDFDLLPRLSLSKKKHDHESNHSKSSSSPSNLARQIVKQVKESVSRKVGQDITNNNNLRGGRDQELLTNFKAKKSNKASSLKAPLDESSNSSSPRLRFIDTNNNKDQNITQPPHLPRVLTRPKPEEKELLIQKQKSSISVSKCKKGCSNDKFSSRMKRPPQTSDIIRNKQEEPFIVIRPTTTTSSSSPNRASDMKNASKSKRTHPLSNNLLNNINTVPNLFPIKTDPSPPSATKVINQKQSQVCDSQGSKLSSPQQLSSCSSHIMHKQHAIITTPSTQETKSSNNNFMNTNIEDKPNDPAAATATTTSPEFQYITGILSRTITNNTTAITSTNTTGSLSRWFSPTHPLDPSIFDHLERHPNSKDRTFSMKNQLGHRWNRKLMFDLVDEVLMEALSNNKNNGKIKKLWFSNRCGYQGTIEGLMERVWSRIEKSPCKKCECLEDIDGLIEAEDMEKVKVEGEEGLEEEGEWLVAEIEGNIWDTLVHESVMVMDRCSGWQVGAMPLTIKDGVVLERTG